jgi:NTE family protein
VLVQINPMERQEVPKTTADIMNRLNEISFNASLMVEMRAIDFVQRLLDSGRLEQPRYRRMFLHAIEDEERMRKFKLSTKFNGSSDFLQTLRQYGREAADRFLATHFDSLGRDSTLDIQRYL